MSYSKIWCLILSLFALASSCGNRQSQSDNFLVNSSEVVEGKLSDLVKINRIVPLETNDSSVMQSISSIKKRNGRYYIISKYRPYVFDGDGKFLFMPSRVGQGPGEYSQQVNCMDADNEHIYLYAPPKLITLNLNGEFVKETVVDWGWGGEFRKIPQGFLTVTENMPDSTHIGFYDNDLNPIVKDARFSGYMDLNFNGVWARYDEGKYIQNGGRSTDFYLYDADTQSFSKIRFSDREDGLTAEEHYELAWKQKKSDAEIPNFMVSSPQSFGDNCIWYCKESPDSWPMYYKPGNSKNVRILKPTTDDITFLEPSDKFLAYPSLTNSDENQIITILNIDDIDTGSDPYINRMGIYSQLGALSPEPNPIIIEFEIL